MSDPVSKTTTIAALCDYLLGDEYRPLLIRAVLSRLGTTRSHADEHTRALDMLEAAFPGEVK